jgi:hypothetical protein
VLLLAIFYDGRHQLAKEIVGKSIPTTRRYQELLGNKEIDCIVAAVPDHWHKQIVVDAVNAGKDIYCEKPMSHSVSEGFEMVAAAQKSGRLVQIGAQRTSSVLCAKARELYQKGAIGDLCLVEDHGTKQSNWCLNIRLHPTVGRELDWETGCQRPRKPLTQTFSHGGVAGRKYEPSWRPVSAFDQWHAICPGHE